MVSIEFILKKECVEYDEHNVKYSVFAFGDDFSISFNKNKKILYLYDCINAEPDEHDLDKYDYVVINNYVHYTIDEMVAIYKEYIDGERASNSSKKLLLNYNEKMSLEKLKDNLTNNWRFNVFKNIFAYAQQQLENKTESQKQIFVNNNVQDNNQIINQSQKENV